MIVRTEIESSQNAECVQIDSICFEWNANLIISSVVVVSDEVYGEEFVFGSKFNLFLLLGFLEFYFSPGPWVDLKRQQLNKSH
jgi:hypothetical protein